MAQLVQLADEDSLERWKNLKLSYSDTKGLPALREAISGLYNDISSNQLVVCAPEEGIYLTMLALLRPGDHVVCTYPGYQSLYELAEAKGCKLSWWEPVLAESTSTGSSSSSSQSCQSYRQFKFDLKQLEALLQSDTRLVVVNFPHNPTGATLTHGEWEQLLQLVKDRGAFVFSDEMYKFTELPPNTPLPSAVERYDRGITLCGLSKSWALPGLRIGWVACQDQQLLQRVCALKDYTTICSSGPSEILALMAVRATATLTQRSKDIIAKNLTLAEQFFTKWSSVFEWIPPQGSPICFPRVKSPGVDIDEWCEKCVYACGVLLLPASVYEHEASSKAGHFRFSLGRENMGECLGVLDTYLSGLSAA